MKAFLELQICNDRHLRKPTTQIIGDEIVNTWNYTSISWACQGEWKKVEFRYKKSEYDYNVAMEELEKFIKRNS